MAGIQPGLDRIRLLNSRTKLKWRSIHVAGTNGKGTVCAYISSMLEAYNNSAYRLSTGIRRINHGCYTSPHLVHRRDCISLGHKTIPLSIFKTHEKWIRDRNDRKKAGASSFEILTATAFRFFSKLNSQQRYKSPADVVVLEAGMGGAEDATNMVGMSRLGELRGTPLVTVFTKIGLDHQQFLGNSIEEIAHNKAGIMKPGIPVVYDRSNAPEVCEALSSLAGDRVAPTRLSEDHFPDAVRVLQASTRNGSGSTHTFENVCVAFEATWNALVGLYRLPNHIAAEDQLNLSILARDFVHAALNTSFPGRLQYTSMKKLTGRTQPVLLDGAHNAQSALVLAKEVDHFRSVLPGKPRPVTWVFAATDTKDVTSILKPLLRKGDTVFPVEFGPVDGMPWVKPISASSVGDAARQVEPAVNVVFSGTDLTGTLRTASDHANEDALVVAGSLYLVGDILRVLRR